LGGVALDYLKMSIDADPFGLFKNAPPSQSTVENEQSIINAMIKWLHKRNETYITGFDFKKLKRLDRGAEENRRSSFSDDEIGRIRIALAEYIKEAEKDIDTEGNLSKAITGYYLGFSLVSGLRRGEQLQLRWCDVEDMEHTHAKQKPFDLIKITVRGETSKVRKTRKLVVRDYGYYSGLLNLRRKLSKEKITEDKIRLKLGEELIFTTTGKAPITPRAIEYHFNKVLSKAKIYVTESRDLVPYSFRHYFITQRVNSRLPPAIVAEMCGTSITQIEKTYYHTTEEKMVSNALADYDYVDGVLVPKQI